MGWARGRLLAVAAVLLLVPATAAADPLELRDRLSDATVEREELSERLGDTRELEADARVRLAVVDAELDGAEGELTALQAALARASAAVDDAREREAAARAGLDVVVRQLADVERQLASRQTQLEARVIAAFKYGHVSLAEVVLTAEDIGDFLNSHTYVGKVLEGDRELVEEVHHLLLEVEAQRAEAVVLRAESERQAALAVEAMGEVDAAVAEQERLTELIRRHRAERELVFEELRDDRTLMEAHLAGLDAESARIAGQLEAIARQQAADQARREAAERAAAEEARRQAELERQREQERLDREATDRCEAARQRDAAADELEEACGPAETAPLPPPEDVGGPDGAGGWSRPVPGPLTSPFGPRWGRNHNGVDLGGVVGTTVRSARSGTVVHVTNGCHPTSSWGCGGGFGNYVLIAHPDGMATIYAHLSSVAVGVGAVVGSGATVGQVGNSGNSYGPHLHFEVRDAGTPRDPCGYISC